MSSRCVKVAPFRPINHTEQRLTRLVFLQEAVNSNPFLWRGSSHIAGLTWPIRGLHTSTGSVSQSTPQTIHARLVLCTANTGQFRWGQVVDSLTIKNIIPSIVEDRRRVPVGYAAIRWGECIKMWSRML
ncbi:Uncharacterized protein HZ326_29236 [Fusarium oxysporum f. sp. albedinis]|nr:Uncharacterized protein HZ326_29236 [Fusarium oxysporum f. sp. albedinis]